LKEGALRERAKPLTSAESALARRVLLERAFQGELPWAEAIRDMRLSLGKTQADFGRLFGLSRRKVIDLEAGKANPELRTLSRIGKAFGLIVGFVPTPEMRYMRRGRFEIFRDKAGEFRFRLKATNGQVVLASEGYAARQAAEDAIESLRRAARDGDSYDRKETASGQYRFHLKAAGRIVGTSENYVTSAARDEGIAAVKKAAPDAETVDLTGD